MVEQHSVTSEILRKILHLSFIIVPISYYFFSKEEMFPVIMVLTILVLVVDLARHFNDKLQFILYRYFAKFARISEARSLTGASFMMIASVLVIGLFPKVIAITSLSILVISDSLAALVGKYFGRIRLGNKTLEGSLTFFFSGITIVFIISKMFNENLDFILYGTIAVFGATFVEFFSKGFKIDDNLSIPLTIAIIFELLVR
ncbi:Cytidylyltransferase family protein [Rickettsiales bacterium Ac37b]|nr:Cytidylyltransferase family protein [Rickettsiales bacterium Ac37b]